MPYRGKILSSDNINVQIEQLKAFDLKFKMLIHYRTMILNASKSIPAIIEDLNYSFCKNCLK